MTLSVITLAAGKGSRMQSEMPKVLHPLAGKPMLAHVLASASELDAPSLHVVVGHGAEQVQTELADFAVHWAVQTEQKGTGHAVAQAIDAVDDSAQVLILYGDVPLISPTSLRRLLQAAPDGLALLTVELEDPTGYGRIVRDDAQQICAIVEQKDATFEQLKIKEVNTGILAVPAVHLKRWLPKLSANNAQGEYYLTDVIAMGVHEGLTVTAVQPEFSYEVQGVNDRLQLAQLERIYQQQQACKLIQQGVSIADATRFDVRGSLQVGAHVQIDVGCVFEGEVSLGDGVKIGPYCVLKNAHIGAHTEIASHSVIEQARTQEGCQIGPFARLRPDTLLQAQAKVGNFCEIKKTTLGKGAKVNHLSYIGDASVGANANIGAGTITCNYDGVNKWQTQIGENAFIGTNSALVAPVCIGDNATTAAGSVVTKDVGDNELAVARGKQRNIAHWQRPSKQ